VSFTAIIFDFDGVIADSEALANTVLAEKVSDLGLATTLDDALTRYMGKRWSDVLSAIEADLGRELPVSFQADLKAATLARVRSALREIEGATGFIRDFKSVQQGIASSSSPDRLDLCIEVLGLTEDFHENVFSAEVVARGKPHPDIFLHAAANMGVAPSNCLVIEDSVSGVLSGVAAGLSPRPTRCHDPTFAAASVRR
jgi:HAD superfamily hydrolase (TIGR01509 family)